MTKDRIFLIAIFLTILAVPISSFLVWYFTSEKILDVLVIDKTVPKADRVEHKSFFWLLNQHNYRKSDNSRYRYKKDYLGFFPLKPYDEKKYKITRVRLAEIDSLSDRYDVVYFADTYGVYKGDWYDNLNRFERIIKIEGGFTNNDYLLMKSMVAKKKTFIAEFNLLASPTSPLIREKTENLLNIKWLGWTGKFMERLDTLNNDNLPDWIVRKYKSNHDGTWPYQGPGIVFIKGNKIVVLSKDEDLDFEFPILHTRKEYRDHYQLPENIKYPFWFEITFPYRDQEIVSSLQILVNNKGEDKLRKEGIPSIFPAVIHHEDEYSEWYYFTGDFADNPVNIWSSYFAGTDAATFLFHAGKYEDRRVFFWEYYNPLIKNILENIYDSIE